MKPRKARSIISIVLISAGSLLIATALAYELIGYPWQALLYPDKPQIDDLPEPAALQIPYQPYSSLKQSPAPEKTPELPQGDTIISSASDSGGAEITRLIGSFKIPKLSVTENLLEGGEAQMMYGVGHIAGTAMPGGPGNCAVSGHRNYIAMHPFRHLDMLESGDRVFINANGSSFVYSVLESFEVEPEEVWVLAPPEGDSRLLTLITCTPFINPTKRLIVRCELTEVNGGPPAKSAYTPPLEPTPPEQDGAGH